MFTDWNLVSSLGWYDGQAHNDLFHRNDTGLILEKISNLIPAWLDTILQMTKICIDAFSITYKETALATQSESHRML